MLMKGDLVRIPQNTQATSLNTNNWRPLITTKPEYGIILEVKDSKCTVFFNNSQWEIKSKDLQLYGGKRVH